MSVGRASRRAFIAGLGSVAAWPLVARAQQSAMPVIGILAAEAPEQFASRLNAFFEGLQETGYVHRQNVVAEFSWAQNQYDRLAPLAAELVERQATVIVALGSAPAALAIKSATSAIPIVFLTAGDPLDLGLVDSLNRPGGNVTGVTNLNVEVAPKRLEIMHEVVPAATRLGLLVNPASPHLAQAVIKVSEVAADELGRQLYILKASTESELDATFAGLAEQRIGGLVIGADSFFLNRSGQLAAGALRSAIPAIFQYRPFVEAGGLMSYGGNQAEAYRETGRYVGRILKGEKPADLPVHQSTKVELIINLNTARAMGLTIPPPLLARADEVIE
jgi:putative tryptophan/tyrosine transport system substrate-binding protein